MALTYTPPGQLDLLLPNFKLKSTEGKFVTNRDFQDKQGLVVMFICNHCPYVKAIEDRLLKTAQNYIKKNIGFVAVCSNDSNDYPEDSFENLKKRAEEKSYPFPYLVDETQETARAFNAVCTPDIFVFKKNEAQKFQLYYRGRLDDSWKDASRVQKQDLAEALDELIKNNPPPQDQISSMGCSIKWKN